MNVADKDAKSLKPKAQGRMQGPTFKSSRRETASERVLERDLHFAVVLPRAADDAEVRVAERAVGVPPLRRIEGVERFPPELQLLPVPDWKRLRQREIDHLESRAHHRFRGELP
jgi:hypothetical protein